MSLPLYKTAPKSALQALKRMRRLLAKPENWTKGVLARVNQYSSSTNVYSEQVTCVCLDGARYRAFPKMKPFEAPTLLFNEIGKILVDISPTTHFVNFNDNPQTTHKDVVSLLDRAIKLAEDNA